MTGPISTRPREAAGDPQTRATYERLTSAPVPGLVWEFALPSIVSMLISSIYNVVDTYFVGKIDTQSTAAVGIVMSYMAIIQAVSFFFGHGAGNYISRALGARRTGSAADMAAVGFFSAILATSLMALAAFAWFNPLLRVLGSTATSLPSARSYGLFILAGTPFISGSLVLVNQMRLQGNATLSMLGVLSGAVLNLVLDPILIFQCGMGVAGAGMATALSQAVSLLVMLSLTGKHGGIRVELRHFRPSAGAYREIIAGGLPSLARQGCMCLSTICLNNFAAHYGDASVAAFSVVSRIMMFVFAALLGFGQGFQPICGFNYGAGYYSRVRRALGFCMTVATGYCVLLGLTGIRFAPQIVRVFRADDPEVIAIGARVLRYQCVTFLFIGVVVLTNMFLQNIRATRSAVVVAMGRHGICFLPPLFVGGIFFGLEGVMLAQPVADVLSICLAVPLCLRALRHMNRMPEGRPAAGDQDAAQA